MARLAAFVFFVVVCAAAFISGPALAGTTVGEKIKKDGKSDALASIFKSAHKKSDSLAKSSKSSKSAVYKSGSKKSKKHASLKSSKSSKHSKSKFHKKTASKKKRTA